MGGCMLQIRKRHIEFFVQPIILNRFLHPSKKCCFSRSWSTYPTSIVGCTVLMWTGKMGCNLQMQADLQEGLCPSGMWYGIYPYNLRGVPRKQQKISTCSVLHNQDSDLNVKTYTTKMYMYCQKCLQQFESFGAVTAIQAAGLQLHERDTNFHWKLFKVLPVVLPSSMCRQVLICFIYSVQTMLFLKMHAVLRGNWRSWEMNSQQNIFRECLKAAGRI